MVVTSFEDPQLQALLEKIAQDEGFKQPKFAISAGSKPGDNFIGRIFRAVITEPNDSKSLSLIFKASPVDKVRQEILSTDIVFTIETKVYQIILPTLNDFMKKHGLVDGDIFPGSARCYAVQKPDPSKEGEVFLIVLEDKAPEGFRMADRIKGLDADHLRVVLEKLAYWHASSLALHLQEPETADRLRKELFEKKMWNNNPDHPLLREIRQGQLKSLQLLQEPYKKGNPAFDRLEKLVQNSHEENFRIHKVPEDLPCINHGDCWINNFLFKYNKDGVVEDICMVDLQITRVGSPVIDLAYLMCVCTTKETRDAHYESLIRFYHDKVTSHLRVLGCDPEKVFSWDRLQEHLRNYGLLGVLSALVCLPIFSADGADIDVDVNASNHEGNVFSGRANITDTKRLEEIAKRMTDVVADADRWGYF